MSRQKVRIFKVRTSLPIGMEFSLDSVACVV